ncbi:MAG: zf-HC2 domain-containing protein [Phycisphaerales bacterium]|nr:zf-HC2 domain-containing protein [Phycisphaerales bacterium]
MITCKELADFLADYVSNELRPEQLAEFERHMRVCPPCVAYLNTYRQTITLGKQAICCDDEKALHDIPEELVKAILAANSRRA